MESKRSDRLEDECNSILAKMAKLLESQSTSEKVFKLDKQLTSNVKGP
jgi:hypothetical protein